MMSPGDSRIFLCHSSADKRAVRDLYARLRADGLQPWLDEEDLLPGQDWDREITKAVRTSEVVVVCLSTNSISKAGYVQREIKQALDVADEQPEGRIFLIPVRLDDCAVPERLSRLHWVDMFETHGYARLLKALQARGLSIHAAAPETVLRLTVHRAYFVGNPVEHLFVNATNLSNSAVEISHIWFATDPEVPALNPRRVLPKRLQPQETWETWIASGQLSAEYLDTPFTLARARLSTGEVIESVENVNVPPAGFVPGSSDSREALRSVTETLAMIFVDLMRLFYVSISEAAKSANADRYLEFLIISERHSRDLQAQYHLFGSELAGIRIQIGKLDRRISWLMERFRVGSAVIAQSVETVFNALSDMSGIINELCLESHPDVYAANQQRVRQYIDSRLGPAATAKRTPIDDLFSVRLQTQSALLENDTLRSIADDLDQRLGIPYFMIDHLLLSYTPFALKARSKT